MFECLRTYAPITFIDADLRVEISISQVKEMGLFDCCTIPQLRVKHAIMVYIIYIYRY